MPCCASPTVPYLGECLGHDIVTASGTTLLGADNKSGVAEIMTAAEWLMAHPEIPHGAIRIALHAGRGDRTRHEALRRRQIRRALRLHDGRRPARRAGVRELRGRRHDGGVSRLQHAPGLRQGTDGQRHQARGALHRPAASGSAVAGDDRRTRRVRPPIRRAGGRGSDDGEADRARLRRRRPAGEGEPG